MLPTLGAPVGSRRPGHRCAGESGAVTVEAAVALLALTAVTAAFAWCLGLLGAQLTVGEAARAAARVAARGEARDAVVAEARRAVPGAEVEVRVEDGHAVVEVSREVDPPGIAARLGPVVLRASAVALVEDPS
jgi:hypothetical protein